MASLATDGNDFLVWKKTTGQKNHHEDHDDIWDDTELIQAYDRAVESIKEELSMESPGSSLKTKTKKKVRSTVQNWSINDKCVCPYSGDNLYYPAQILDVDNDLGTAIVRYDEFLNESEVDIDDLLQSTSKKAKKLLKQTKKFYDAIGSNDTSETVDSTQEATMNKHSLLENMKNKSKWNVSDICYAPDELGVHTQAVINSIKDGMCNVTFIQSRKRREVSVEHLSSEPKDLENDVSTSDDRNHIPRRAKGQHKKQWPSYPLPPHRPTGSSSYYPEMQTLQPPPNHTKLPSRVPWLPQFPPNMQHQFPAVPLHAHNSQPPFPFPEHAIPPWHSHLNQNNKQSDFKLPIFPPPPAMPKQADLSDEENLGNMLMSWYMSGYHTGYYAATQERS